MDASISHRVVSTVAILVLLISLRHVLAQARSTALPATVPAVVRLVIIGDSTERPNFVLIQFGHNDSHAPNLPEATDFASDYTDYLRRYIDESRAIGATPILITPMVRRTFDADGKIVEGQPPPNRPLAAYAQAMKDVALEKRVAVIDLFSSSKALMEKLGPKASAELANRDGDVTHFNEKGARAMQELVLKDLRVVEPNLAKYLKSN